MEKKRRMGVLIGGVVVLVVTLVIGVGSKGFWGQKGERRLEAQRPEAEPLVKKVEEKAEPKAEASKGAEFAQWFLAAGAEGQAKAEEEGALQEAEAGDEKEEESTEEEGSEEEAMEDNSPAEEDEQAGAGEKNWRTVWADLNLTEEEKGRLRQGVMLLFQKWQAMSPAEQQAERERFQGMRARFEAMNETEKLEVSQRLRKRFDEWRVSGRVELPELTLD